MLFGNTAYDNPASGPGGAPFLSGANNGLSLSTVTPGKVVLGQNVLQALNPAAFLSAREIPQAGFGFNMFGGGVEFSQSRAAAAASGLGVHVNGTTGVNILRIGTSVHDLFRVQDNGQVSVLDVNAGTVGVSMKSQRFVNTSLGGSPVTAMSITSTWQPDNSTDPAEISDMTIGSRVNLPNVAQVDYTGWNVAPSLGQAAGAAGNIRGIWYRPNYLAGPLANQHIGLDIDSGDVSLNTNTASPGGLSRTGIQGVPQPSAFLEIGIGPNDGSPGTGQFKLQQATLLLVPEDGLEEYDGVHFYKTIGAVRRQIVLL